MTRPCPRMVPLFEIVASEGVEPGAAFLVMPPSEDDQRQLAGLTPAERLLWLAEHGKVVALKNIGAAQP